MISTIVVPNRIGTHAPSRSFSKFAEKNVMSKKNGRISAPTYHTGQRHSFQTTTKTSTPSTTIRGLVIAASNNQPVSRETALGVLSLIL